MKKSILVMGLAALLSLPLAVHGAEAPIHLYGNSGIVNMYDHMGAAVYMYKNSARMVAEDRDTGYIFSVDVKDISYNPEADRFQIQSVTPVANCQGFVVPLLAFASCRITRFSLSFTV